MKFILIVTDTTDKNEKTQYFGPFDNGKKALDWGENHFNEDYFLMSTTLFDPLDKSFYKNLKNS